MLFNTIVASSFVVVASASTVATPNLLARQLAGGLPSNCMSQCQAFTSAADACFSGSTDACLDAVCNANMAALDSCVKCLDASGANLGSTVSQLKSSCQALGKNKGGSAGATNVNNDPSAASPSSFGNGNTNNGNTGTNQPQGISFDGSNGGASMSGAANPYNTAGSVPNTQNQPNTRPPANGANSRTVASLGLLAVSVAVALF